MGQLSPALAEKPENDPPSEPPLATLHAVDSGTLAPIWPWKEEFLIRYQSYLAARTLGQWSRAMKALHEARIYAIAAEQWSLESRLTELMVEAIANREARR